MSRFVKHLVAIVVVLFVIGCAGGGCGGGCSGCGLTPLPEGFDPKARVENAASVRLTQSGLSFLQANVGALAGTLLGGGQGVLSFAIPESKGSIVLFDYDVCPGGADPNANPATCTAEIDLANAKLTIATQDPHDIHITGPLPLRLQNLPVNLSFLIGGTSVHAVVNGNDKCPGETQTFADIPLNVDISIEIDNNQSHSRYGYSRVNVVKLDIDQNALQNSLHFCGSIAADIANALEGIIFPLLAGPLLGNLQGQLDSQLCQAANPALNPECPNGTQNVSGICRYGSKDTDECASIILGTDGNVNLGQLLANISPGTKGGLDILLAGGGQDHRDDNSGFSWGDLNPIASGATLGMYGGAEPVPISNCVKFSEMLLPKSIPIPDELLANTVAGWPATVPGPHVGLALSERFTNYALNGMYNSGFLCIGISTESQALLNSGTLQFLAPSIQNLALQREPQEVALVLHPAEPPHATFGNGTNLTTDPLIKIAMNKLSIDFYIFSLDRFIRMLTATLDVVVPVNLAVAPDGLTPTIDMIKASNVVVTNSSLLSESPEQIAKAVQGLISTAVGQALGAGLPTINLNTSLASLGLALTIPESVAGKGSPGLRKLTKGSDNFLGIFGALSIPVPGTMMQAGAQGQAEQADTGAEVIKKAVDPEGLHLATFSPDNGPVVTLHMTSTLDDGRHAVEFSYRVDDAPWHPYTGERFLDVRDDWLRLQGRHVLRVRSRAVGNPRSLNPTPANVEVLIDTAPPAIRVGVVEEGKITIDVQDLVSSRDQTMVRVRFDGKLWSEWQRATMLAGLEVGDAQEIEVEAKDEEGNIGTVQEALVRGKAPAMAAAGCGCTVAGQPQGTKTTWLLCLSILAAAVGLSRRGVGRGKPARASRARALGGLAFVAFAGSWAGCSCGSNDSTQETGTATCVAPGCKTLEPGLIGEYTSAVIASDGTIWVAGYLEANYNDSAYVFTYGDLVVGQWNGYKVDWTVVDGVPSSPTPDSTKYDVSGFRGGQTKPGDDVGLWTSIAVDDSGNRAVAYYDRTHKALKFAQNVAGAWAISTVDSAAGADVGKYAKLLFVNGAPVIAYLAILPAKAAGPITSQVRVATGSATPGEGAWQIENAVVSDKTPCRDGYCPKKTACIQATGMCTATISGCSSCTGTAVCIDSGGPTCAAVNDANKLDSYPDAVGDYIAIARDPKRGGIGIAHYSRTDRNLATLSKVNGKWTNKVVDGPTNDTDPGDVGIGTSLAIDSNGDWHLSYVDGYSEGLRYIRVLGGTKAGTPEVVDDGLGIPPQKFQDGQHLIGDDSNLLVTASGEVHISYQDATAGTLHYAVGTSNGDQHDWTVKVVDQPMVFAGAFSRVLDDGSSIKLLNWWRVGGNQIAGDVDIVSP